MILIWTYDEYLEKYLKKWMMFLRIYIDDLTVASQCSIFWFFKVLEHSATSVLYGRRLLCRKDYFTWRETTVLRILLFATLFHRDHRQISLITLREFQWICINFYFPLKSTENLGNRSGLIRLNFLNIWSKFGDYPLVNKSENRNKNLNFNLFQC